MKSQEVGYNLKKLKKSIYKFYKQCIILSAVISALYGAYGEEA